MYQALYRQYRPKNFDEVLGQKHIINTLKNQIEMKNIGHAYLFSGTRGTGKTSTAKIFSRAVNCLNPVDSNPCNECEICKGILDESIMDVIEMDAASNNGVDDIRDLREKVVYPPSRARYKVYIIDEVHMLSKSAFNALLKTLEEPPKHLIFILATTEPEKLPKTILSRCQRFDFKRITSKDIIENMKIICEKMNIDVEDSVLSLIARNSDGAMRDALSLLDQCVSFSSGKITYENATNILGMANADLIFNMVDDIIRKNLEGLLGSIDEIIQNGKDINQFIKDLIYHFRNLMIIKTSKNPMEIIDLDPETLKKYLVQSGNVNLSFILRALDILTSADEKAKWSTQPRIILEMTAINLTKQETQMDLEERVRKLEMGIADKVPQKEIPVSAPKAPEIKREEIKEDILETKSEEPVAYDDKDLEFETIANDWEKVLQTIKSKKMNIYALLIEGELISYTNNLLTIGYKEGFGFHKDAVNNPANKEFVEHMVSNYFKKKLDISFTMKGIKAETDPDKKKNKEEAIKKVIDFFGEDIVEIK